MNINLHMIVEDLRAYAPNSRILEDYTVRRLRFPALFDGKTGTRRSRLYVVEASALTTAAIECVTEDSSLLVIGTPPPELLDRPVNVVWIPARAQQWTTGPHSDPAPTLGVLFEEVTEYFSAYVTWSENMQNALISKHRLKRLGALSGHILKRPLYLIDSHLQMLFADVNESLYELPADYQYPVVDNNNPALSVLALERFTDKDHLEHKPFLLPSESGCRTLAQNLFLDEHLVATLFIDEIGIALTMRDYSLLDIIAEFIVKYVTYREEWNTSVPRLMGATVRLLLKGSHPAGEDIDAAMRFMAWSAEESYYVIVAVPTEKTVPEGLLAASAKRAVGKASQMIYEVYDGAIVFISNTDHSRISQEDSAALLARELAKLDIHLGMSNIFSGFWNLYAHYQLARHAHDLGRRIDPQARILRFEDYFMDYLILRCKEATPLEAVIPHGVLQLRRYDEKYGTDLLPILETLLRNDMRISSTARELFLHRNTLTNKIAQIRFITRLDFENDPEVRLKLMVALKMMSR
jgi:sugar diacid utilization regulator